MSLQSSCTLPTEDGPVLLQVYHDPDHKEPLPWVVSTSGDVGGREGVLVRVHDACLTSEILRSIKCDCEAQLREAQRLLAQQGGVLIYTPQEGRGIGLAKKIAAYHMQQELQLDTVDANRALGVPDDARSYTCVPSILRNLGVRSIRLLTNNPFKAALLRELGIAVLSCEPLWMAEQALSDECRSYLNAKVDRMGHVRPEAAKASLLRPDAPAASLGIWRSASETLSSLPLSCAPPAKATAPGMGAATAVKAAAPSLVPLAKVLEYSSCQPCQSACAPIPAPALSSSPLQQRVQRVQGAAAYDGAPAAIPRGADDAARLLEELRAAMGERHSARDAARPFVTVAYAQGLDGSMCGPLGARGLRLMLSGAASIAFTHRLRAAHEAVLVGVGTLLADDPRLTVRLAPGRSPLRVVLDSRLRTPLCCQLLRTCGGADGAGDVAPGTVVVTLRRTIESTDGAARAARLRERGATVLVVASERASGAAADSAEGAEGGAEGGADDAASAECVKERVSVAVALEALRSELGVRSVMIEGGVALVGSLLGTRLVDFMVVTVAPVFAGGLRPTIGGAAGSELHSASRDAAPELTAGAPPTARAHPLMAGVRAFTLGDDVIIGGRCDGDGEYSVLTSSSTPRARL